MVYVIHRCDSIAAIHVQQSDRSCSRTVKVDLFHQVGISVPGATLGDRSTSCLGRHLCQSDHDDDVNDEAQWFENLVLRQPAHKCQWTPGENSDSPQFGNLKIYSTQKSIFQTFIPCRC